MLLPRLKELLPGDESLVEQLLLGVDALGEDARALLQRPQLVVEHLLLLDEVLAAQFAAAAGEAANDLSIGLELAQPRFRFLDPVGKLRLRDARDDLIHFDDVVHTHQHFGDAARRKRSHVGEPDRIDEHAPAHHFRRNAAEPPP
jgi:hypothetical protein